MPGTNWVDLIQKAKTAMENVNKIKSMVNGLNDLNFDSLMAQVGLDDLAGLDALSGIADSIQDGLSVLSNLPSMNGAQLGMLSSLTGVPEDVLNAVASGEIPDGFSTDDLNELVNSVSTMSGIGDTVQYLSDYASELGETELSTEVIQQALEQAGGSLPGLPASMGTTTQDAQALLDTVQNIQQSLGGSLNQIGSSISGLFPADTMSVDTLSPDILESVGVDPNALADEVSNLLGGTTGATSSLDSVNDMLEGLGSTQLTDLTSSIYNIKNIEARIARVKNFKTQIVNVLGGVGVSVDI